MKKLSKNRLMKISYITLMLLSLYSCQSDKKKMSADAKPPASPTPVVDLWVASRSSFNENLEIPGNIISGEMVELHPEISGRLVFLNVPEGKTVSEGTLIAKIFDEDLQAQLGKLKVQLELAKNTYARFKELATIQGVSKQDEQLKLLELQNLESDIEIVKASIRKTEIRAPFTGTIGLKQISQGAFVTPQTAITQISQTNGLNLDFSVPEYLFFSKIAVGNSVSFKIDGNEKTYHATIKAFANGLDMDNRSLPVRALILDADANIKPGIFARVFPAIEADSMAILIPSNAVIPQAKGKKVAVYRNGEVAFNDVQTGSRDSSRILIKQGIQPGDSIILTGLMGLKPGMKVNIGKINTALTQQNSKS